MRSDPSETTAFSWSSLRCATRHNCSGHVRHATLVRRRLKNVTLWLALGKNAGHVKEAVGHADLKTTMGYTHLAREHLRGLVEAPVAVPAKTGSV